MTIDYKNLNDRIVKQAFDVSRVFLSEDQRQRLFQNKIDRASDMLKAREVYHQIED